MGQDGQDGLGVDWLEIHTEGDWDMPDEEYEVCQV